MTDLAHLSDASLAELPAPAILARLEAFDAALERAERFEDVKLLRDQIAAVEQILLKIKVPPDVAAEATIRKLRAEHKLGTLLREMPRNRGGMGQFASAGGSIVEPPAEASVPTYAELGIAKTTAHRYQQVASVPCEELEERIKEAVAESRTASINRVLKEIHKEQQPKPPSTPTLPPEQYGVILGDPPWKTTFRRGTGRDFENHYAPMELEAIKALGVPKIAAPDCILFLWAVSMLLPEALEVMRAWGFTFKASAVWVKDKMGMGFYWRLKHEYLLVGTKGSPGVPDAPDRFESVIYAERGEHSEKPVEVHEMIERMYPNARRIELFARAARPGWDLWGAEAPTNGR